jgi:hypothetical protein
MIFTNTENQQQVSAIFATIKANKEKDHDALCQCILRVLFFCGRASHTHHNQNQS